MGNTLSSDQKKTLLSLMDNNTIERKVERGEYKELSRREWKYIFNVLEANIESNSEEGFTDEEEWLRDLYNDSEKLMQSYHPEWMSSATEDNGRINERIARYEKCGSGQMWVSGYYRYGRYVSGYCRRI